MFAPYYSGHLAWLIQNILGEDAVQQRIAFLCPNDVSYIISQWATWMAGHIAVPLYPRHPPPELEYFVRDSEAAVIITTSEYAPKVKQILSGQQVIVLEEFFLQAINTGRHPPASTLWSGSPVLLFK